MSDPIISMWRIKCENLKEDVEHLEAEIEAVHAQIDRLARAVGFKESSDLLHTLGAGVRLEAVVDHTLNVLD